MSAPAQGLAAADRLADRHFAAIVSVVEGHVGIKLPPAKRMMVEGRLRRRVRALGLDTLQAYGAHLFDQGGLQSEFVHLIDCVTTNKTDFFREPSHFDFMRTVAVPTLLTGARGASRRIKVWSAACSTGAEAYTIAMVLQEMNEQGHDFRYSILGTDVSTEVLAEAQAAIYRRDFIEPVPAPMQQRFLMHSRDARSDLVRVIPELRSHVQFSHLNLMDASYPFDRDVDLIFCRNVLIYFDQKTQNAVVRRLMSHLRPGGYLILGHSESMAGAGIDGLDQVRPTIYQNTQKSMQQVAA
jgi:chemotaxis protein methyltransferase CheR